MSQRLVTKRARANTAGDSLAEQNSNQQTTLQQTIPTEEEVQTLEVEHLAKLLRHAAEMHPDVHAMLNEAIKEEREKRLDVVHDFNDRAINIWNTINVTYSHLKSSKQRDQAWDVVSEITYTLGSIAAQCDAAASPGTKVNGLWALCLIGEAICCARDTLGSEVRKQFETDPSLENAMHDIVSAMSVEERRAVADSGIQPNSLWERLLELENEARPHCVFEGLDSVMDLIEGIYGDGEGPAEDYDEDDEDGEDGEDGGDGEDGEDEVQEIPGP